MPRRDVPLTPRDLKTLRTLSYFQGRHGDEWARPMDIGGRNRSHHSATLRKLARRGLVESRSRSGWAFLRGSLAYRITDQGRSLLDGTT